MNLEKLKQAKKEQSLTIAQIAEHANLPKGTVQNIFCGYVPNPRSDTLQAIEKALGIGSAQSIEWTDEDKALGVGAHPTTLSEDEWEWLELRSEALRLKGKEYVEMLERMIKAAIEIK